MALRSESIWWQLPRAVEGFRKQARRPWEILLPQRGVAAEVIDSTTIPGWIGEPPQARQGVLDHRHTCLEITLQDQYVRPVRLAHKTSRQPSRAKCLGLGVGRCRPGQITPVFPGVRHRQVREAQALRIAQFVRRGEQLLGMEQGRLVLAQQRRSRWTGASAQSPDHPRGIRGCRQRRLQPAVKLRVVMCRWSQ